MIVKHNRGLRFRTNFKYESPEQKQKVLDHLSNLPIPAFAYENEHAKRTLICDFPSEAARIAFEQFTAKI